MNKPKWGNIPINIKDYHGFVYVITNLTNGKRYIGKKCFWNKIRRKPLKGQKRVRLDVKESNWKSYWGSCKKLLHDIEELGYENFRRDIIRCFYNKADLAYIELKYQMDNEVLYDDKWYNNIINVRLGGRRK